MSGDNEPRALPLPDQHATLLRIVRLGALDLVSALDRRAMPVPMADRVAEHLRDRIEPGL